MMDREKIFFLQNRGKIFGPFSLPELRKMRHEGRIDSSAQISRDKLVWSPLPEECPAVFSSAAPSPVPVKRRSDPPASRVVLRRLFGIVLQFLWNAPAAREKISRVSPERFWKCGFSGALFFSLFLFCATALSTGVFSGEMPRRALSALAGMLLWDAVVMGELLLLQKTKIPQISRPAGEFFMLYSMGASGVNCVLLLCRSVWETAGQNTSGAMFYAVCTFTGSTILAGIFGTVNLTCGIHGALLRRFRIKPAPALWWTAFFLLQSGLLFFCGRL